MNHDEMIGKLNDYVDGLLSDGDAAAVEVFLRTDAEAREEVAFLQELAAEARALPRVLQPERDLWGDVSARIATRVPLFAGRSAWFRRGLLAVAVVVLMALSSAFTAFWMGRHVPTVDRTAFPPATAVMEQPLPRCVVIRFT